MNKYSTGVVLSEALALGDVATVKTGSYQFKSRSYKDLVRVYADTDITVINTKALTVTLEASADDTTFAALTSVAYTETAGAGTITYSAGDLICEQVVPESFVDNFKYVRASIATTDDLSAMKVNVLVEAIS
jgi:hypothetical protein